MVNTPVPVPLSYFVAAVPAALAGRRNIRIVSLVPPTWSAALPALQGKEVKGGPATYAARKGITTLLIMRHFQLILDTLASAAYGNKKDVPDPEKLDKSGEADTVKKREGGLKSNVMAVSVIMPWARTEVVKGSWSRYVVLSVVLVSHYRDVSHTGLNIFRYILLFPLVVVLTPSPGKSIQSILYALSAPVRHGELQDLPPVRNKASEDEHEARRAAVAGGDVVRNSGVVE